MPYILLLLVSLFSLPSCSAIGLATSAGATVGIAAAQEGGIDRATSDARIQAQINDNWFDYDVNLFTKLDITVNQGRVLVTGIVQDPQDRVEAIRLIWQVKGVEQVINEVQVSDRVGVGTYLQDQWIMAQLRTQITFDKKIQSINYNIDAVGGSVYLLGVSQSQEELNAVIELARSIAGVRQVVSYVKMAGEPKATTGGEPAPAPRVIEPLENPTIIPEAGFYEPAVATDEPVFLNGVEAEPLD